MSVFEIFLDSYIERSESDALEVQAIYLYRNGYTIQDINHIWFRELGLWYDDDCAIDNLIDLRYASGAEVPYSEYHAQFPRQMDVFDLPDGKYKKWTWHEHQKLIAFMCDHSSKYCNNIQCDLCSFVSEDQYTFLNHAINHHGVLNDGL